MQEAVCLALRGVADAVSDAAAAYNNLARRIDSPMWTHQLKTLADARYGLRVEFDELLQELGVTASIRDESAPYMVHQGSDALTMIEQFEGGIGERINVALECRLPQTIRSRLLTVSRDLDASLAATRTLRLEAAE